VSRKSAEAWQKVRRSKLVADFLPSERQTRVSEALRFASEELRGARDVVLEARATLPISHTQVGIQPRQTRYFVRAGYYLGNLLSWHKIARNSEQVAPMARAQRLNKLPHRAKSLSA